MAKLATTVHIVNDKGETTIYGPDSDLPDEVANQLAESWGTDREDLWAEAPKAAAKAHAKDDPKK